MNMKNSQNFLNLAHQLSDQDKAQLILRGICLECMKKADCGKSILCPKVWRDLDVGIKDL